MVLGELLDGPFGTAQQVSVKGRKAKGTLSTYFIEAGGQNPFWHCYTLHILTLADHPKLPPAHKQFPSATHEIILAALDPTAHPWPGSIRSWKMLHPLNLVEQVELPSDEAARELLRSCAAGVVQGHLWAEPGLSGAVEPWRTVLVRSAAHLRGEVHDSGLGYMCFPEDQAT